MTEPGPHNQELKRTVLIADDEEALATAIAKGIHDEYSGRPNGKSQMFDSPDIELLTDLIVYVKARQLSAKRYDIAPLTLPCPNGNLATRN